MDVSMTNQNIKRILWATLLASSLMFVFIAFFLKLNDQNSAIPTDPLISYCILGFGITMIGLSFFIPNLILKTAPPANLTAEQHQVQCYVVGLALNEAASILAFILKFIQHDTNASLVLFALSLGFFIGRFPKAEIVVR